MPIQRFEFNTGVRRFLREGSKLVEVPLSGEYQRWKSSPGGGQVKVILFTADVPEGATFFYGANSDKLPRAYNVVVAPISGGLQSKYGYFRISTGQKSCHAGFSTNS